MTRCRDGYSHASDSLAQKRQEKSGRDLKAGLPPISGYKSSKGPSGTSRAGRLAEARSHEHTEDADSHPVLVGHGVQTRPRLMSIQLCSSSSDLPGRTPGPGSLPRSSDDRVKGTHAGSEVGTWQCGGQEGGRLERGIISIRAVLI